MKREEENLKTSVLRTGIYVRVSTEEQAQEGFSIRAQSEKLKSYALLKDWEIFDIYSDEGISGKNIIDRPAVNRLVEDVKNGNINNVLVFKVDRLTRSTKDLIELVDLFEKNNCAFNSLTESIDTETPSGRMFLKIIGIFAEFERENLVSRLKLGFERKVKEGYTLANYSVSYGYFKKKGQKIQKVQPDEAKIVREIFSMYLDENKSMFGIALELNERKIKTKRNGIMWDTKTVKQILTNPTYIGKVRYSCSDKAKYFEADGHHEGIITEDVFFLTQEKLKRTSNISRTKRPKEDNYFCGVLVCGICGSKFHTHQYTCNKNGDSYRKNSYRCGKKRYYDGDTSCKCPDIVHSKVEQAFIEYIEKINDFTGIDDIAFVDNSRKLKERERLEHIASCENKLNSFQKRKKRVMEQYVSEEITFDEYKSMLSILNQKCDTLALELQKAKNEIQAEEKTSNVLQEDVILNLKENWSYLDNNEKMMFLQKFIKKIVIRVEKEHARSSTAIVEEIEFNSY